MSEDHLDEDKQIKGQHYVCLSLLTPNSFPEKSREKLGNQQVLGLKVRGVYATLDEASARAQYLQKLDKHHNVFVGEVGKWLPIDADLTKMENDNQVYRELELNKYMKAYKDALVEETEEEKARKEELLKGSNIVKKAAAVSEDQGDAKDGLEPPNAEPTSNTNDLKKELEASKNSLSSLEEKIQQIKELSSKLNA